MRHKIRIHGHVWTYSLMNQDTYAGVHDNESAAMTIPSERKIDFLEGYLTFGLVIHELVHAFKSYLCLDDADNINDAAYEEIYATFFQNNGLVIIETAAKMYLKLNPNSSLKIKELQKAIKEVEKLCN